MWQPEAGVLDAQGNKVYGSWTKVKKIKITVITPQQPKIRDITVKGNTVTITYTKCKNATGYEILLGTKYKTSAGEKYPVKKICETYRRQKYRNCNLYKHKERHLVCDSTFLE